MTDAENLAKQLGMPLEQVKAMLEQKDRYEHALRDVAEDAKTLGITPEEFIARQSIDTETKSFLRFKGFHVDSSTGLAGAREWLKRADPNDMFYTDGEANDFDITMGELRRGMMLDSLERLMQDS